MKRSATAAAANRSRQIFIYRNNIIKFCKNTNETNTNWMRRGFPYVFIRASTVERGIAHTHNRNGSGTKMSIESAATTAAATIIIIIIIIIHLQPLSCAREHAVPALFNFAILLFCINLIWRFYFSCVQTIGEKRWRPRGAKTQAREWTATKTDWSDR